jgi:small-conductance mechanosensitive channel
LVDNKPSYRRLLWPTLMVTASLAGFAYYAALRGTFGGTGPRIANLEAGELVLGAVSCLALAWLISRSIELVVTGAMARKGKRQPRLLYQMIAVLLFLVALLAILSFAFDRSLVGLVTTSGVLVAILGFALRNIIADIFSGIALSVESPYRIGDWVETELGARGRVVEINWRSTRVETRDQVHVVLPNSRIAAGRLTNFSAPRQHYRVQVPITLDFGVPVARARRALLAGVSSAPGIRGTPAPDVRVDSYADRGIRYVVRYWLPSFADEVDCRDAVLSAIDRHLRAAGIAMPHGRERVLLERAPDPEATSRTASADALRRLPLFEGLEPEVVDRLGRLARSVAVAAGDRVAEPAEQPETLFVVSEGLLTIGDGENRVLAMLGPGDVFGATMTADDVPGIDMSGTDAVVSAKTDSLLFELPMKHLRPVLEDVPALATVLSYAEQAWQRPPEFQHRPVGGQTLPVIPRAGTPSVLEKFRRFFT